MEPSLTSLTTTPSLAASNRPSRGAYSLAFRRMLRHKLGVVGLVVCLLVILIALSASFLAPHDPAESFSRENAQIGHRKN